MPQGEKNTILRIDALFQEDFRRTVHQSNGEVEISEYEDIREHLDTIELMKRQDEEARAERKKILDKKQGISPVPSSSRTDSSSIPESAVQPSEGPVDTPMRVESPARRVRPSFRAIKRRRKHTMPSSWPSSIRWRPTRTSRHTLAIGPEMSWCSRSRS